MLHYLLTDIIVYLELMYKNLIKYCESKYNNYFRFLQFYIEQTSLLIKLNSGRRCTWNHTIE